MAKRKASALTPAEATAQIAALCAKPTADWERADWKRRNELAQRIPAGVPVAAFLERFEVHELADLPDHFDDAIVAALDTRPTIPAAAFVRTALATGRGDRHARLRELCRLTFTLTWAAKADQRELAALVAKRPDIVEGARAAMALVERDRYVVCRYLPVLAVEASRDSLDLLVPYIEELVKTRDSELDWFRKEVVPLLGDTPAAKNVIALLSATVDERTEKSPARAFAKQLGMNPPPPLLQATLTFRDGTGSTVYQIRIDSTKADWLEARRNEKWQWRSLTLEKLVAELPAERASYVLRVSKGDRKKLDAWAKSL